jgi:DNA polymerase-3 subunit epsilon
MREIVLDTETTGLDPNAGHRVIEIGCIELMNHIPTGVTFHRYINPERAMPDEAFAVHGLSEAFLAQHPVFAAVAAEFLEFVGDAKLVIHNAGFDIKFLNAELERLEHPPIPLARAVDTVQMARQRFPGAQASLDALCRRFEIDNSRRDKHGALLDAELLSLVYLELIGGRQPGLELAAEIRVVRSTVPAAIRPVRPARPHAPSPEEEAAHAQMIAGLADAIWLR